MRCPARLRAMTSLRSAGSYVIKVESGRAGAAAFAAQLFKTGGALVVGDPSDAIVDEEGVRGKVAAVALTGIGLSITCGRSVEKRPGNPIDTS